MPVPADALISLSPYQGRTLAAVFDRFFPADEHSASASDIGAVTYLDRALSGFYREHHETYRIGLRALDDAARAVHGAGFPDLQADAAGRPRRRGCGRARCPASTVPDQRTFADLLLAHVQEGVFADPRTAATATSRAGGSSGTRACGRALRGGEPRRRAGRPRAARSRDLADAGWTVTGALAREPVRVAGYSAAARGRAARVSTRTSSWSGWVRSAVSSAPLLAGAGLKVVGLEAGPYRTAQDFVPDELNAAYYCRGDMGPKFQAERPRWRPHDGAPDPAGGLHPGPDDERRRRQRRALGRRAAAVPPAPLRVPLLDRRAVRAGALPEHTTVTDWPLTYDELEPTATRTPSTSAASRVRRRQPLRRAAQQGLPDAAAAGVRLGALWEKATREAGPAPVPDPDLHELAAVQRPAGDRVPPRGAAVPGRSPTTAGTRCSPRCRGARLGNLDLRTHCRVVRVLTDCRRPRRRRRVPRPRGRAARAAGPDGDPRGIHVREPAADVPVRRAGDSSGQLGRTS